ncbi:head-tail adaptor protein [Streptomyces sp. A0642]|uniref:phage head completion protein n=1 Tax=Streptomyces sp. A0642 TaxID=2563100 RepID=UPI0010A2A601|nr:head-tail adaptor protein [Streptomyces sp. A0642]THA78411.1 head-tail adaptor protein [Streptomyces sp. A0642]
MSVGRWLNRTLQVWRPVTADDGYGGQDVSLMLQTDVGGKVDQPSATDQTVAQQAGAKCTHSIYLLPTADVRRGDELRGDGQAFAVHVVFQPSGPRYNKALCELRQAEGN